MKKFYLFIMSLFLSASSFAFWDTVEIYNSSFTTTNETLRVITNTPPGTIFAGVVIGTSSVGGSLKVYNSSGTATNQLAEISLSGPNSLPYNIVLSSGLTYTSLNATGGVTILYKRVR